MRIYLFGILCLFIMLPASAEDKNALLVWTHDGGVVGYELSVRPTVKIVDQNVVLAAGDVKVSYPLGNYVRMSFGRWDFASVPELSASKVLFRIEDDHVIVSGLAPGEVISLYSAGGVLLWNGQAGMDGGAVMPLRGEGVRVVKVGTINFKIDRL